MSPLTRLTRRLADALMVLGAFTLLLMTFHVTADVLFKVSLHAPIAGTLEIVTYIYMVACIFLPLPHVQAERELIVVELFTQRSPEHVVLVLERIGALLTACYLGMLAWWGGLLAIRKTGIGETADATYFEVVVWPMRWVLVACCALAALIALLQAIDRRAGRPELARDPLERRLGELEI